MDANKYRVIGKWCVIGEQGTYLADFYMKGFHSGDLALFEENAEKTCRAMNLLSANDELVHALKVAKCEIELGGTVDREQVLSRITQALKRVEEV